MTFCRFNPAMTMRIAILREARRKFDSILGLNRLIHSVPHSQSQSPPLAGSIYHGLNSFCFGGSLELMAVPKRKTSPHKRGIRNGPKALKPVPVLVLCKGTHLVWSSGIGLGLGVCSSLRSQLENLWGKYNRNVNIEQPVARPTDSSLWKAITTNLWPNLNEFCYWSLGDGQLVDAWSRAWIEPRLTTACQDILKRIASIVPPDTAGSDARICFAEIA
ncbi:ribosomal L32P protein family, partial [Trifolium pratense]